MPCPVFVALIVQLFVRNRLIGGGCLHGAERNFQKKVADLCVHEGRAALGEQ